MDIMSSSEERITMALASLKADLMDMRSQDVQLMKQLIAINTTISSMSNRRRSLPVHRSASFSVLNKTNTEAYQSRRCSDSACNIKKVLTRHNSEPVKTHRNSSMEELDSSYEDLVGSDYGDSDNEYFSNATPRTVTKQSTARKPSLYFMRPLPEDRSLDEKQFHGILMKNIKLWKYSQESLDSD